MKTALKVVVVAIVLIAGLLSTLFAVSPVRPEPFEPSPIPALSGVYAPELSLDEAQLISLNAEGPEAISIDSDGNLYTGLANGDIVKISVASNDYSTLVNTGGRPLGLTFDQQGRLVIADAITGLLRLEPNGSLTTLIDSLESPELGFLDDVVVTKDNVIWVTQASQHYPLGYHVRDFFEASMTGRLLRYDPRTNDVSVALDGLFFANGVTASLNEDFLLINETGKARILRHWLSGEQEGETDVFIDGLPALPDNIRTDPQDGYWVALVSLRTPQLNQLYDHPVLLRILGALPPKWAEPSQHYGLIAKLSEHGEVLETRHSETRVTHLTSVIRRDQQLIIGSLTGSDIAVVNLSE